MGGPKDGGGGGSNAAEAQARMAQQLFGQTDPLRRALIDRSSQFLGIDPSATGGLLPLEQKSFGGGNGLNKILPAGPSPIAGSTTPRTPFDLTSSPVYGALASATDAQYKRARDNTIGSAAPGGALTSALSNVESGRANMLAQGTGAIAESEMGRAFSLATGLPATSLGALGQAGATQAGLSNAQANRDAAAKSGVGQGVGSGLAISAKRGK